MALDNTPNPLQISKTGLNKICQVQWRVYTTQQCFKQRGDRKDHYRTMLRATCLHAKPLASHDYATRSLRRNANLYPAHRVAPLLNRKGSIAPVRNYLGTNVC